jgi:hypothetical protein
VSVVSLGKMMECDFVVVDKYYDVGLDAVVELYPLNLYYIFVPLMLYIND